MLTNIWNTQTGNSDGNQFQIDRLRVEVVVLHLSKYSVQSWVTVKSLKSKCNREDEYCVS